LAIIVRLAAQIAFFWLAFGESFWRGIDASDKQVQTERDGRPRTVDWGNIYAYLGRIRKRIPNNNIKQQFQGFLSKWRISSKLPAVRLPGHIYLKLYFKLLSQL